MPRKRCCGQVDEYPICRKFVPDQTDHELTMTLGYEELEAIRLKDVLGLNQAECADQMALTRPTFQRLLISARKKFATAIVEGQTIIIQGGHYQMANRVFECVDCAQVWEEPPCTDGGKHGYEIACPKCGSMKKLKINNGEKHACGGANHDHNHEHGHGSSGGGCCGK